MDPSPRFWILKLNRIKVIETKKIYSIKIIAENANIARIARRELGEGCAVSTSTTCSTARYRDVSEDFLENSSMILALVASSRVCSRL